MWKKIPYKIPDSIKKRWEETEGKRHVRFVFALKKYRFLFFLWKSLKFTKLPVLIPKKYAKHPYNNYLYKEYPTPREYYTCIEFNMPYELLQTSNFCPISTISNWILVLNELNSTWQLYDRLKWSLQEMRETFKLSSVTRAVPLSRLLLDGR